MKDPEQGDRAPAAGVSRGQGAGETPDGLAGSGKPPSPAGSSNAAWGDGSDTRPKSPSRRRRKRGRGRKVYIRAPEEARPGADAGKPSQNAIVAPKLNGTAVPRGRFDAAARGSERPPAYAALDLGTNNCRLLVAVPTRRGQFRVIDAFSRIVRLGEGLSRTGRLSEAAMDRAIEALAACAAKLEIRQVKKARLIATEACRSAENGTAFLERVHTETGLSLEIIDRQTEARLAVSGCGSLIERDTQGVVLFDIGGGSSEIALVDLRNGRSPQLANHIAAWTSLPVGVVSLAERHGGHEVSPEIYRAMIDDVAAMLQTFAAQNPLSDLTAGGRFHLLGTSGTVTTLAGVHLDLARYDRRRVDGLWMNQADVDAMIDRLLGWNYEQRMANPCIGPDRADLVLAGCAILQAIRDVWPSERLRVADRGLREGMLSELMAEDGAWRRRRRRGERRI